MPKVPVYKMAKPKPKTAVNEQGVPIRKRPLPAKPKREKAPSSVQVPKYQPIPSQESTLPQEKLGVEPTEGIQFRYPRTTEQRSPLDELKNKVRTLQSKWHSMPDEWVPSAEDFKESDDLERQIAAMEGPQMSVKYPGTLHRGPLDEDIIAGNHPLEDLQFDPNDIAHFMSSGDEGERQDFLGHLASSAKSSKHLHSQQAGAIIGHALEKTRQGTPRIADLSSTPPNDLPVGHMRLIEPVQGYPSVIIHAPEGKYTSFRTVVDKNGNLVHSNNGGLK